MLLGSGLTAIGFFLLSQIAALWQFYVVFGSIIAIGHVMIGGLACSTLVARWFIQRRGLALGISMMGVSLSGMLIPPLATELIEAITWRNAYLVYGVITFVVCVPPVLLFVVNRPEDIGLAPDGVDPAYGGAGAGAGQPIVPAERDGAPTEVKAEAAWSFRTALRNPNFWIILGVVALSFASLGAVLTHIIPHGTDIGLAPLRASFVLSCMAGFGVLGKVLFGWIVDRIEERHAFWLSLSLQTVGVFLVLNAREYPFLLLAGAIFGLGMGGVVPLWAAMIAAGFGRDAFGSVMGLMSPFMAPIQSLGVPFAGWIFDRTGSYDLAFQMFIGIYAVAAFVLFFLRLPEVEPGHADVPADLAPRGA
jgi:predicted MFS family arabinose efflux permease